MIATISGQVSQVRSGSVVVELGGLGYEVFLPLSEVLALKEGANIKLFIHEHIREDAHTLYGFSDNSAQDLFENLLSVSGVGPKVALAILSSAPTAKIKEALAGGDADVFKAIAGVGQKTAQRIIVELRGKLEASSQAQPADPAYQALISLGYTAAQAAKAAAAVPADITDEQHRIKAALKELGS